jgi:hypothetical protein
MSLSVREKLALARTLAGDLTEKQANLIRHAIDYLRRVRDKDRLKVFLNASHFSATSQEHWPATSDAILRLVDAVKELGDLDYVLGWAWRLRKVLAKPDTDDRGGKHGQYAGSRLPPGAPGGRTQRDGRRMNYGEAERRAKQQQRKRW